MVVGGELYIQESSRWSSEQLPPCPTTHRGSSPKMLPASLCLLLAAFVPFLSISSAAPAPVAEPRKDWHDWKYGHCLSDADAKFLVDILVPITVKFDPSYVTQFLTDDFALYSDSVNFLLGLPVRRCVARISSPQSARDKAMRCFLEP